MLSSLLPLLILISPIASISLPAVANQQPLPNVNHKHLKAHFRDIKHSDLAAITTIIIEAFAPSAAWTYLIPDLAHHKAEVWACYNAQIEQAWPKRNKKLTRGKVIIVPDESSGGEVPVSFSFWNIRTREEKEEGKAETLSPLFFSPQMLASLLTTCTMPPGTNLTRAADFTRQNDAIERKYFDEKHSHQLYLHLLATHPDWDGNGFGAQHCEWGMQLSRELEPEMPVTLLASPAGFPLYDSLGFESVKNATITKLDGLGELWFEVMEWDGDGKV